MDLIAAWKLVYQDDLPNDITPFRDLLKSYSHIPESEISSHLHNTRNKAWATCRTPCIGRWRFLYNISPTDPRYKLAVSRLKSVFSRDVLLDLGCGMGQAMRQLINDGVPATRVLGTDLHPAMIDLGLDLFCDREESVLSGAVFSGKRPAMGTRFVVADLLDDCDPGMKLLNEKVTIIHASNFWHIFSWHQQIEIAVRLVSMLKPGTQNALIYGRQIGQRTASTPPSSPLSDDTFDFRHPSGTRSPSVSSISSFDSDVAPFSDTGSVASSVSSVSQPAFLHNHETFQLFWDIVGERTLTKWRVEMDYMSKTTAQVPGFTDDSYVVHYGVYQTK